MNSAPKCTYVRPRLVVYGKLEEITQETRSGNRLDSTQAAGTSLSDLLVS